MDNKIVLFVSNINLYHLIEFDDGSELTLSKCLTHANRTSNLISYNMLFISLEVVYR